MKRKKQRASLPFYRSPRFRYGALSTALVCACLAALLVCNLVLDTAEKRGGWRRDYSFNALLTTTEQTRQVLDTLEHPVHIYALYDRGREDAPLLELLDRYAALSDLVTWEQTSISLNPALLDRFQGATSDDALSGDQLIVSCEATGRWKILNATDFVSLSFDEEAGEFAYAGLTYERSITQALSYVSRSTVPRVMILQGHGELDEDGTALFASLLDTNGCDVYYFTLDHADAALSPDDLLVLLSPVRDLTDAELKTIAAFAQSGGSLLMTCDYSDPISGMPNYASLLRMYGFEPKTGMVLASQDEPSTYYQGNRAYLIPAMCSTDITQALVDARDTFLVLAASRAFAIPTLSDRSLRVEPVLVSSSASYLRDFSSGSSSLARQEGDEAGPFALALQAERVTDEGAISRAFVLGASTLLTSEDGYAITVSQELILRVVQYLLREQSVSPDIMAKVAVRPGLSAASVRMGSLLLVMLPLSVLCAALLVLLPRRNR